MYKYILEMVYVLDHPLKETITVIYLSLSETYDKLDTLCLW